METHFQHAHGVRQRQIDGVDAVAKIVAPYCDDRPLARDQRLDLFLQSRSIRMRGEDLAPRCACLLYLSKRIEWVKRERFRRTRHGFQIDPGIRHTYPIASALDGHSQLRAFALPPELDLLMHQQQQLGRFRNPDDDSADCARAIRPENSDKRRIAKPLLIFIKALRNPEILPTVASMLVWHYGYAKDDLYAS